MFEIDPREIRRVLVRQVNWVGDAVLTLPAMEALDRRYSAAEIHVLANPWVSGLLEGHSAVDRIIGYRSGDRHAGILGRLGLSRELAQVRYDLAVLFPNSLDAALIPWLAGIPRRVGYATDGRGWFLTHALNRASSAGGRHQVEHYLDIVRALGGDGAASLRLPVSAEWREKSRRLLREHRIAPDEWVVLVNPGSVYGGAKRWPGDRFAAAADALVERRGVRILLVGSVRERSMLEEVASRMRYPVLNLGGGTDLPTLIGLLNHARLLVSNDTGAMHLAAAAGTPVLAVFGPTNPQTTGPLGLDARIIREPVPCAPCLLRECPIDHRCMTRVTVDQVVRAAVDLLETTRGSRATLPGEEAPPPGSPGAFLDRDGTIIEDVGYLGDPEGLRFLPGALEALSALQGAGFRLVVITNQAGVARGLISEADVRRVNGRLATRLAEAGIALEAIYYCPHHADHGTPEYRRDCACRKPRPGMIQQAIRDLGLDPSRSVVIGDHITDAAVAEAFPGMRGILLRTGHGADQWRKIQEGTLTPPEHVADDLRAAVNWFLSRAGR